MTSDRKICCLIPALNEAGTISAVIEEAGRHLEDVVVVDDGSEDATQERARKTGASVLVHPRTLGKGMALRTGFEYVIKKGFDAVITIDADGQHNPSEISKFVAAYENGFGDIIIGSRLWNRSAIPLYRFIPNRIGVFCISKAAGWTIDDSQSGYRLYRNEVLEKIPLETKGFETETEILIKAGKAGFRISNLPISVMYGSDQKSHFRPVRDFYRISILVLKLSFRGDSR